MRLNAESKGKVTCRADEALMEDAVLCPAMYSSKFLKCVEPGLCLDVSKQVSRFSAVFDLVALNSHYLCDVENMENCERKGRNSKGQLVNYGVDA